MDTDELEEEIQHQRILRKEYRKRLRVLQQQAAKFGETYVPPHVQVEIDDLEEKIQGCDQVIKIFEQTLTNQKQELTSPIQTLPGTAPGGDLKSNTPKRRLKDARILWVDNRPADKAYARKSMEALGIHFAFSTSTQDALKKIQSEHFDLIISDMNRPPDFRAGYHLLEELRRVGIGVPYIIYAAPSTPEKQAETKRRGGYASTDNAQDLFQFVIDAIQEG
jgi:CheY-like chemotaxis protein